MKLSKIRKFAAMSALCLSVLVASSAIARAQVDKNHGKDAMRTDKNEQKADRERTKMSERRVQEDQQRQSEWTKRNTKIVENRNKRIDGKTYYNVEPTVNFTAGRYRVYRNGSYYNTDNRGADMLRKAINEGYRQGFATGRSDFSGRRNSNWSNNTVYRTGTYGYSSGVDRRQYQYYFQQGFQRGYQDGSNRQYQDGYTGNYQYGYNEGGTLNVLGTILNEVLNIQTY